MGIVIFDPFAFKTRYPEFNAVLNTTLTLYFNEAAIYLSNKPDSIVQCLSRRSVLLNMLTAHIGVLAGALSADGQAKPVGRVTDASEGSVSVSLAYNDATPGSGSWFQQTQYGASFWSATSSLRGMHYRPSRLRIY